MSILSERIAKTNEKIAQLELKRKELLKKDRDKTRKINHLRCFIIGELFCKYFPKIAELTPGTKEENGEIFKELELFLSVLSSDKYLCSYIREKMDEENGNGQLSSGN